MTLPTDPLDLVALLRADLEAQSVHNRQVTGTVPITLDWDEVLQRLTACDLVVTAAASDREIEFHLPHGSTHGSYFLSMEELLKAPGRRENPPQLFYVEGIGKFNSALEENTPEEIKKYLETSRFLRLLSNICDHAYDDATYGKTLVFLRDQKLSITSDYGVRDLQKITELESFEQDFVLTDTHKSQKITIIRSVISELFPNQKQVPFSALLDRYSEFIDRVQSGYELFVADFSYQKVKAEVEKECLEATTKLNKVFSDIQNQMLAIPVAVVLVSGQLEPGAEWRIKNILIWFGALVFSVLMSLLIRNQRNTLDAIQDEIHQQQIRMEGAYRNIAERFSGMFSALDRRFEHQNTLLSLVDGMVAVSLALTTGLLLYYSVGLEYLLMSTWWGALGMLGTILVGLRGSKRGATLVTLTTKTAPPPR